MTAESFRRTVILLSSHDEEGAMGVILNRPLDRRLGQLSPEFALGPLTNVPLFHGGPVEPRQVIICAWRPDSDGEGFQLMFGVDLDRAASLIEEEGVRLRAFLGYSGWSSGQIEDELQTHSWVVSPLQPGLMDRTADVTLWRDVLSDIAPKWRLLAHEPEDPELN